MIEGDNFEEEGLFAYDSFQRCLAPFWAILGRYHFGQEMPGTILGTILGMVEAGTPFSPKRAVELTHTMYEMIVELPDDPTPQHFLLGMDPDQKFLFDLLN